MFKINDKGAQIKRIQERLIQLLGAEVLPKYGADGHFGNEMLEAVKKFQRLTNLADDGIVGKNTMAALFPVVRTTISKNMNAFLVMLRKCEGTYTTDDEGYKALFGWRKGNGKIIKSYADHPRKFTPFTNKKGVTLQTSAAGAYQFLASTYDELHKLGIMPDFSPASQDEGAVRTIIKKGAAGYIEEGKLKLAISKVRRHWASLPGSGYDQPERSYAQCEKWFVEAGGELY